MLHEWPLPDIFSGGLFPPDAHIWYPKIELDQLEKKLRETHRKIFGIVQSYAIGHCQTFLVVECARQTLHIDHTPQIELD